MAATSKPARSRTAAASAAGTTPSFAQASTARTSTSSQVAYRASSVNSRAIGSSAYRGIKAGFLLVDTVGAGRADDGVRGRRQLGEGQASGRGTRERQGAPSVGL